MPPIYDDYCDDTYAIKNKDNHETFHHDFNFQLDYASHDSYFVEFAPTTIDENKFAYVESNKIPMLMNHEKNALCDIYIVVFIHHATKNYYERVSYASTYCNNIKFPLYVLKILKLCLFYLPTLLFIVLISCLFTKSLCIGSGFGLNVLAMCFMMLLLCFNTFFM